MVAACHSSALVAAGKRGLAFVGAGQLRYKHIGYVIKPDTKSRLGIAPYASSVVKHVTRVWLKIKMVVLLMSVF